MLKYSVHKNDTNEEKNSINPYICEWERRWAGPATETGCDGFEDTFGTATEDDNEGLEGNEFDELRISPIKCMQRRLICSPYKFETEYTHEPEFQRKNKPFQQEKKIICGTERKERQPTLRGFSKVYKSGFFRITVQLPKPCK